MLSAWNSEYHNRHNKLDLKLKKIGLKLNRWWIFYKYTGNPDKDPLILTSRPKNIPLVSLRTDEYGNVLTNQEYIGHKWEQFWQNPKLQKGSASKFNSLQNKRIPLGELKPESGYNNRLYPLKAHNEFTILNNVTTKANISKLPKKTLNPVNIRKKDSTRRKRRKKTVTKPLHMVNQTSLADCGSLDSLERNLLESANLTFERSRKLLPFGGYKKSLNEAQTPPFMDFNAKVDMTKSKISKRNHPPIQEQKSNENIPTFSNKGETGLYEFIDENGHLDFIDNDDIDLIDMDYEFYYPSIYRSKYLKRAISNKTNYNALGFDADHITVHNDINATGVKGWIANKVRPETRSTFDNRMTLDSNPIRNCYQNPDMPLIQRPEFFDQGQKIHNKQLINNPKLRQSCRENQVKNYVRSDKVKRERRKEIKRETKNQPIPRRVVAVSQDEVISMWQKIKDNTKDIIWERIGALPKAQDQELQERINHLDKTIKKPLDKNYLPIWKIFNGHWHSKNNSVHQNEGENLESTPEQIVRENKNKKVSKVVKIVSPPEDEIKGRANWELNSDDAYYDDYDIIAEYEDL